MPVYKSNRTVMDEGLAIFLNAMGPFVLQQMEAITGQPAEMASVEVLGEKIGNELVEDLASREAGVVGRGRALTRISLTVEFCWPVFKKQLRNKKVAVSALKQIEFSAVSSSDGGQDLECLYVEQRFEEMEDILRRIDAVEALGRIKELKSEIK